MKKVFSKLVLLTVNYQLVFAPYAMAEVDQDKSQRVFNTISNGLNMADGFANQIIQQQNMVRSQVANMQMQQNMRSRLNIQPLNPAEVPAFLSQKGCAVIPRKIPTMTNQCEPGNFDPALVENGYYDSLSQIAFSNMNDYENFKLSANSYAEQGKSCYDQAQSQFKQQLAMRIKEVEVLRDSLYKDLDLFEAQNQGLVKNIEKGQALLTGKPKKFLKDVDFEKNFKDPQCLSFMAENKLTKAGKKGGLRGIEEMLATQVEGGKGRGLSAERLSGNSATTNQIEKEIRDLAKAVAKKARNQGTTDIFKQDVKSLSSVGTKTSLIQPNSKAFQTTLASIKDTHSQEYTNYEKNLKKVAGRNFDMLLGQVKNNEIDIATAARNYEREAKNNCLTKVINDNFGSAAKFTKRFENINVSKKFNREADSLYKNTISSILNDNQKTIEQKLKDINGLSSSDKKNHRMRTGKSMALDNVRIGASESKTAPEMISIFVNNCNTRYSKNDFNNGYTQKDAVSAFKRAASKYQELSRKYANDIETQLITDLVSCPSQKNVGVGKQSCSAESLDNNSGNFCLRTAKTCASNMVACKKKAEDVVNKTRLQQVKYAEVYRQNWTQKKLELKTKYEQIEGMSNAIYSQLDAQYPHSKIFANVEDQKLMSLKTDEKSLLKGIDEELMLEDPKAFKKAMESNFKTLVKKMNDENKSLAKYADNKVKEYLGGYGKEQQRWQKIRKQCKKRIAQYNKQIDDENKIAQDQANEFNKLSTQACTSVQAFNHKPIGYCGEASEIAEQINEAIIVGGSAEFGGPATTRAIASLREYDSVCQKYMDQSETEYDSVQLSGDIPQVGKNVFDYCKDDVKETDKPLNQYCRQLPEQTQICASEQDAADIWLADEEGERKLKEVVGRAPFLGHKYCITSENKVVKEGETDCSKNSGKPLDQLISNGKESIIAKFVAKDKDSNITKPCYVMGNKKTVDNAIEKLYTYAAQKARSEALSELGQQDLSPELCMASGASGLGKGMMGQQNLGRDIATMGAGFYGY